MPVFLAVAAGGALGSLSRYAVDRLIERRVASVFPWSTFTINVTGCLSSARSWRRSSTGTRRPNGSASGLIMGVLGGYTTFSTFGQESYELLRGGHAGVGVVYALGSLVAGVIAVGLGTMIGRAL